MPSLWNQAAPADIAPGSVPAFKRSSFHSLLDFLSQQKEQTSVQFSGLLQKIHLSAFGTSVLKHSSNHSLSDIGSSQNILFSITA